MENTPLANQSIAQIAAKQSELKEKIKELEQELIELQKEIEIYLKFNYLCCKRT